MTAEELAAIEERLGAWEPTHSWSDDPYLSCPKAPQAARAARPCDCDYAAQVQRKADIDALVAELRRVNARRWACFVTATYYPQGGMKDCVSRHATREEAEAALNTQPNPRCGWGDGDERWVEDLLGEDAP